MTQFKSDLSKFYLHRPLIALIVWKLEQIYKEAITQNIYKQKIHGMNIDEYHNIKNNITNVIRESHRKYHKKILSESNINY